MKKWIFIISVALVAFLITGGIAFYMFVPQTHRVKNQLEKYTITLSEHLDKFGSDMTEEQRRAWESKFDELSDQVSEAESYLLTHAPSLLPEDRTLEKWQSEDAILEARHISKIRAMSPEAANRLQRDIDPLQREQELIDLELEIAANKERRERERKQRQKEKKVRESYASELKRWMAEERDNFIFDVDGNITGIKESSRIQFRNQNDPSRTGTDVDNITGENTSNASRTSFEAINAEDTQPSQTTLQDSLGTEMVTLDIGFYETYPDVIMRFHLSENEYLELFPTAAERRSVENRVQQLELEYANRITDFINKIPADKHQEALKTVENKLTQNWNEDFAIAVMSKLKKAR